MRSTKYLFITSFLSCMVVCLSAPHLWAGGTCSETATESTDATKEEILSEFDPSQQILLDGNFYLGDVPSQIDPNLPQSGEKGPAAISELPDTSKPAPEAETESNVESVVDYLQPYVLGGGDPKETLETLQSKRKKAFDKWWGMGDKLKEQAERARTMQHAAESAAIELKVALDDAMDAEPGSEEAREAGERASDAAKKAEEYAKEAEKAKQEYEKAKEEASKAYDEYEKATEETRKAEKAEAEKQNEAAREAAEKAYEATKHGKSNKK
jgi:hypothetical protein